jgi:hypothetical protein
MPRRCLLLSVLVRDLVVMGGQILQDPLHHVEKVARLGRELGQHSLPLRRYPGDEVSEGERSETSGVYRRTCDTEL